MKAECEKKHKVTLSQLVAEEEAAQRIGGVRPRSQVSFRSGAPRGDIGKHLANKVQAIENNQFKSQTHKQAEHLARLPIKPLDIVISPGP